MEHPTPPITNPPSPASNNATRTSSVVPPKKRSRAERALRRIHAFQVHGFIEAAEAVEVDPETIKDILDGFDNGVDTDNDESDEDDLPTEFSHDNPNVYSEWASFFPYLKEGEEAWSKDETGQMMTDLKEYGRNYFLKEYVITRAIPIPKLLYAFGYYLCEELRKKRQKTLMYFLEVAMSRELESREKLPMYNTVDDAVFLIRNAKQILILTGAGISNRYPGVSCGIPDFRSRNGLYATLQSRGEYNLDDPQQMFDIHYFKENPAVFYSFASQIYPSNFIPSPCHRFIKLMEDKGKLLRNYTQNIDTLETRAGVHKVLQCHGSFATASCINCRTRVPGNAIEDDIMNQRVPLCRICPPVIEAPSKPPRQRRKGKKKRPSNVWEEEDEEEPDVPEYPPGIMKPDITFFGEKLSDEFDRALAADRSQVDLILVIGTSLKVSPVAEMLSHLPHSIPQIVINKTPIRHANPDIVLLGNADDVVNCLCRKLDWDLPEPPSASGTRGPRVRSRKTASQSPEVEPLRVGKSHVWLFQGAEGGKWVEDLEARWSNQQISTPAKRRSPAGDEMNGKSVPPAKKSRSS